MHCATPRTKVVFPAPSSPVSSTTSPDRSRSPSRVPASSVSAVELLVRSGKVGVARAVQPDGRAGRVDDLDGMIFGQRAHDPQPGLGKKVFRSHADELGLLPA